MTIDKKALSKSLCEASTILFRIYGGKNGEAACETR